MLVEARILGGDYSVLKIGRDLAERNEFVPLLIRRVMNPGLNAALHVHRGSRRVDPPYGHKEQRGDRPKDQRTDDKPSNEGAEHALPAAGPAGCE